MPRKITERAKRLSISIPAADTRCLEWIKSQTNVSSAIRFLIHDALSRWGTMDVVYDVMPAAIAAVSSRRGATKRFVDELRNESSTSALPSGKQVIVEAEAQETPQSRPAEEKGPEPAQPAVPEPDDEDYFVDPAQFL